MIWNRPARPEFVRWAAIGAAAALLSGSPALSGAQFGGRERNGDSSANISRMTRSLSLTDDQAKQIKGIYDSHQADRAARSQAIKAAREALQKATVAMPLNEQGIKSAAQAVGQAEGDSALLEARIRSQIGALLNADQQQKFASYHDSGGFGRGRGFPFRGNSGN
jgi:Spy/CpxP family protein refolding chaperone